MNLFKIQRLKLPTALFAIFLVVGCANKNVPREATESLYSTDRSLTNVIADVKAALENNKYTIKKLDVAAGILVTGPRKFTYDSSGGKVPAEQTIQMRFEGGSIKTRITYECRYPDGFMACRKSDKDIESKIRRIEKALYALIMPALDKKSENATKSKEIEGAAEPEKVEAPAAAPAENSDL